MTMPDLRPPALKDHNLPRLTLIENALSLIWPPSDLVVHANLPWIEHVCRAGDGRWIFNTLSLHPDHKVTGEPPDKVTVSPSVLCTSCKLHGFVRSSVWEPCSDSAPRPPFNDPTPEEWDR